MYYSATRTIFFDFI